MSSEWYVEETNGVKSHFLEYTRPEEIEKDEGWNREVRTVSLEKSDNGKSTGGTNLSTSSKYTSRRERREKGMS